MKSDTTSSEKTIKSGILIGFGFYPHNKHNVVLVNDSYFRPVFNFMYFLFLSPFKVDIDIESKFGEYVLRNSSRFHKCACAVTHFGTLAITFNLILSQHISTSNISQLIESIGYFSSAAAVAICIKSLWLDQGHILNFMNATRISPVPNKIIYISSFFLLLAQFLASKLNGVIHSTTEKLISVTYSFLYHDLALREVLYGIGYGVTSLGITLYPLGRLMIMIMSVQLKSLARDFESSLEKETSSCVKSVAGKVENLKNIVDIGRKWTGHMLTFHYICTLTFLANLPEVMRYGSYLNGSREDFVLQPGLEKWHAVFTCAIQGFFLLIACDMPERVHDSCQKWISRRFLSGGMSCDDKFILLALAQRMEGKPLGLSCVYFTLTYSFVGSMLGLVTTYGVLVFQVNK